MASVSMAELRSRLAHYLDRVQNGEEVLVTRRGRAVAVLKPHRDSRKEAKARLRMLRKRARIGDVESPIGADWEATRASS